MSIKIAAVIAIMFGLLTILSGGLALFGAPAAQAAVSEQIGLSEAGPGRSLRR